MNRNPIEHARAAYVARAAAKRELRAGVLSFAAAVADPRLATMPAFDLLQAQHRWGRERARTALEAAGIFSEHRPVGELTDRQRTALVDHVTTTNHGRRAAA